MQAKRFSSEIFHENVICFLFFPPERVIQTGHLYPMHFNIFTVSLKIHIYFLSLSLMSTSSSTWLSLFSHTEKQNC